MKKFTFNDSVPKNRTGKAKRWLGWLTFCGVLLLGQIGFAFLVPNLKEASNNELVSTETQTEYVTTNSNTMQIASTSAFNDLVDCSQISESTLQGDGWGLGGANNQDLAGDFIVSEGSTLVVDTVKVSVNVATATTFDVIFWSDNSGLPGTVLYTLNNVTSTNPVLSSGTTYYMHTLDISFQNPSFTATGADTRYWMQVKSSAAGGWERRSNTGALGVDDAYRQNNGTWNTIYTDPPTTLYNLVYEVIGECVDCVPPTNLSVTQGSTDITLNWTGGTGTFDVEWGLSGFALGTGTEITGLTTNSTTIDTTTLDYGVYEFYVAQDCGNGDVSVYTGPYSFSWLDVITGCDIVVNIQYSSWGDAVTWQLLDGSGTAVLSGGPYSSNYNITETTTFLNPPYTLNIISTLGDNGAVYSVNVGGDQDISGSSLGNFNISVPLNATSCPVCPAPTGLAVDNITFTSADLSWSGNGGDYELEWGHSGFTLGTGTMISPATSPVELTGLTGQTNYQFYVREYCGVDDGYSSWAGPFTFYTDYCLTSSQYTGNRITDFSTSEGYTNILNLNNGIDNAYSNYSALSVTQSEGGSFDYAVSVPSYTNVEIWIDFNNNMIFDTDELVASHVDYGTANTTFTGTIDLPATIADGDYRMRVRSRYYYNTVANPCGEITYGETEDYTLTVVPVPDCLPPSGVEITLLGTESVAIEWQSTGTSFEIEYGLEGFTEGSGTTVTASGTSYTFTGLTETTAYTYYVRQDCTSDNNGYSLWAGPFNFTTATPGQIGNGNTITNYFPIYTYYGYNYSQQIYYASELLGALDEDAYFITKIGFKPVTIPGSPTSWDNWTVYMGNTDKTSFDNTTDWIPFSELNEVFSGTVTFTAGEWMEIYLDTPFVWDGVSNLVVAVDENTPGYSGISEWASYGGGANRGILYYADGTNPDPANPPTANYAPNSNIAQIKIDAIELPTCMPAVGLSADGVTFTSADLSWESSGSVFEIEYGESGFTLGTGTVITNVTGTSITIENLDPETLYQFYVRQDCTSDNDGYSIWSAPKAFYTGYCLAFSSNTSTAYRINGFSTTEGYTNISNLNNGITDSYNNYSNYAVTQSEGESFNYAVDVPAYTNVEIWIDYNDNMIFDTDELVAVHAYLTAVGTFTGTINIPADIDESDYRMRVRSRYYLNTTASPCGDIQGETEDYTLSIVPLPDCVPPSGVGITLLGTESVAIDWQSTGTSFEIEYGLEGFTQGSGTTVTASGTSYTFTGLTETTAYTYYVRQDCTSDNNGYSLWAGPYNFTTATPGQIGNGNTITNYFPIYTFYGYNYSQQIYYASELLGALDEDAYFITKIGFKPVTIPGSPTSWDNWTVYMGNTDKTSFDNTTDWVPFSDLEEVFSGIVTFTAGEWMEIYLDTPFVWDGVSNLVVAVDENTPGYSGISEWASYGGGANRGILYYADGTNPDPANPPTANYAPNSNIAQIKIDAIELPTCMPAVGLSADGVTFTSADLSWESSGSVFEIEYGENGFAPGTGTIITNVTGTSITIENLDPETLYQFYVRQDCTSDNDGYSIWSAPRTFYTGYCLTSSQYTGNRITDFSTSYGYTNIMNMNNGTDNAYSNYSALSVTQSEGGSFDYAVSVPSYTNLEIWVDFNNNMIFDTDELVAEHVYLAAATTFTGTINIPAGLADGDYRIRARSRYYYNTAASPCGEVTYGEVEDYTLTIVPVPDCMPPNGLSATPTSLTEVTLAWSTAGDLFDVEWGPQGFALGSGTQIYGLTTNSTSVDVTIDVPYQFYVRQDCNADNDGYSLWSGPFPFKTGYCVPQYLYGCTSGASINNFETFDALDNIANSTGCGGSYNNFSSISATAVDGTTVPFSVGISGWAAAVKVWVDWNNNGVFESDELMSESTGTIAAGSTYSGEIAIPLGSAVGSYRVRVRAVESTTVFDACNIQNYGETEDYTLMVIEQPDCMFPQNMIAVNTSATGVSLSWSSTGTVFDIEYGPTGFTPGTGTIIPGVGNPYTLSPLTGGVTYDYYVRQDCTIDGDGYSMWRGPISFTPGVFEGNIPSLLNANPQVDDIACATSFSIDVPDGYYLSALNVQYVINSWNSAFQSHQRSVLYSPTLNMGEAEVVAGTTDFPGMVAYNRDVTFANGATGTVEFQLKVWRTDLGSGCGENYVYVMDGSWVLDAEFELIPTCPEPTNPAYTNATADSVDLIWTADPDTSVFDIQWGLPGFDPELNAGTTISGLTTSSYTLSDLDSSIVYEFYVRSNCSTDDEDDFSDWIGPVKFNSGYCIPSSTYTHFISTFLTTDAETNISYYSTSINGTGYGDKTDIIVSEFAGESFNFSSNYVGGQSGLRIWVDWNNDFVFEDSEEMFYLGSMTGSKTGSITIPSDQAPGNYVMRVRVEYGAAAIPSACGNIEYGEALDFTLNVATACDNILAPTGDAEQTLDLGDTLVDLVISGETGATFTWYSDADLTTEISDTTEAVDGATYWVTQTVGDCTSDALAITVTVIDPCADVTAPTATSPQPLTEGQTVADIVVTDVTGTLNWYSDADLTITVAETDVLTAGEYTFWVTQTVGDCTSDAIQIVVEVTLNRNAFDEASFRAYPNPVNEVLTISYSKDISDVTVINMLGQVVISQKVSSTDTQVDMSALPTGNYLVKVTVDGAVKTIKVVKQ